MNIFMDTVVQFPIFGDFIDQYTQAHKAQYPETNQEVSDFFKVDTTTRRRRAGLLFIESYRSLPLLAWPRKLICKLIELEQAMVLWRSSHARMVERMIGRRMGTGGSSGVDYLDATLKYRIFVDLWAVRTILVKRENLLDVMEPEYYGFNSK